jgi:hypothetical protein
MGPVSVSPDARYPAHPVLLLSLTYTQVAEVLPSEHRSLACADTDINMMPNSPRPELTTSTRALANHNIMSAVMLTGVMLLQVRHVVGLRLTQAGRYYVKQPTPRIPPTPQSPIAARASTPYRELTEEEALELVR